MGNKISSGRQDRPEPAFERCLKILAAFYTTPREFARRLYLPPHQQAPARTLPGSQVHDRPEMFFMIEGINRIDFPGARHYLRAGHACLIPRGVPHRETYLRVRGRFRMLVIMFRDIRPSFFINDRCKVSLPDEERHGFIESAETGCMTVGLDNLAMLSAGKDRWRTAARQAFGFGLLAWLIAIFKNPPEPARYSPIITRALYEIDERLHDPGLGTTTIAVKIGCVPDYLSALFHKETGTRLIEHIHRRRIEKAKYLLGHTAMRVKEIAHACGFSTPDYFTRLFRRATRQAPRQFRADNSVPSATARFYSD